MQQQGSLIEHVEWTVKCVADMCGMMLLRASTWLMLFRRNDALEHQPKNQLWIFCKTNKETDKETKKQRAGFL